MVPWPPAQVVDVVHVVGHCFEVFQVHAEGLLRRFDLCLELIRSLGERCIPRFLGLLFRRDRLSRLAKNFLDDIRERLFHGLLHGLLHGGLYRRGKRLLSHRFWELYRQRLANRELNLGCECIVRVVFDHFLIA